MLRITKLFAGVVSVLVVTAAVAFAADWAQVGKYTGNTSKDGELTHELVRVNVVKDGGEKYVDKVVVDQRSTPGCEATTITKNAGIQKNSKGQQYFVAKLKTSTGYPVLTVRGTWVSNGVISGDIAEVICDGAPRKFVAYHG